MPTDSWKRDLVIAAVLVGCGVLALPFAIYWVGTALIGAYSADPSAFALAEQIWTDLLALDPFAWLLVSSPYLLFLVGRLLRRVWRTQPV